MFAIARPPLWYERSLLVKVTSMSIRFSGDVAAGLAVADDAGLSWQRHARHHDFRVLSLQASAPAQPPVRSQTRQVTVTGKPALKSRV